MTTVRARRQTLALAVLVCGLLGGRASAVEPPVPPGPPPDPTRGDRYDGRARGPLMTPNEALVVPRLLFSPIRLALDAVAAPVQSLLTWEERNHVLGTILRALSTEDGMIGLRPAFLYSISFTPIVGVRVFDRKLLGPTSNSELTLMVGGVDVLFGQLSLRPTPASQAAQTTLNFIYNRRNDQVFTGIGYATDHFRDDVEARYSIEALDALGTETLALAPGIFVDFSTGLGLRLFSDGIGVDGEPPISVVYCVRQLDGLCRPHDVDPVQVPGFHSGTQFFRAAADLRFDSRDNQYRPSSGGLLELGVDYTHGFLDDDSHYVRLHGGLSGVLDLYRRTRTLVVRVEAHLLQPLNDEPVPFSELIILGGPDTFRGFRYGRFRNLSSLFAALEYRWPIWMWMDADLFAEYGGVFGKDFEGFDIRRMLPDVGAGIRLRSSDAFFIRAHVAYGFGPDSGIQFSLSVNTGL